MGCNISPGFRHWIISLLMLIGFTLGACTAVSGRGEATALAPTASSPGLTTPTSQQDVTYDEALDLATQQNNPDLCGFITVGVRQDFIAPVAELIDECQAQIAVATRNLDYCLTLKQKPKEESGARTQRDI